MENNTTKDFADDLKSVIKSVKESKPTTEKFTDGTWLDEKQFGTPTDGLEVGSPEDYGEDKPTYEEHEANNIIDPPQVEDSGGVRWTPKEDDGYDAEPQRDADGRIINEDVETISEPSVNRPHQNFFQYKSRSHDINKYGNRFDLMLKKNWENFHYTYPVRDFLSRDECIKLMDDFDNPESVMTPLEDVDAHHTMKSFDGDKKEHWRVCEIRWLRYYQKGYEWLYERLDKVIKDVNERVFNFDLTDPIVIEDLQITKYNKGGLYKSHTDWNGKDPEYSTRKISFSIILSCPLTDYKGGGLFVDVPGNTDGMSGEQFADRYQGSITFFPSFIKHEAIPVEEGERYVIVGWIQGPPFK